MIRKSFSVLLCGLMLVQGQCLPVLANEEEMAEEIIELEAKETERLTVYVLYQDNEFTVETTQGSIDPEQNPTIGSNEELYDWILRDCPTGYNISSSESQLKKIAFSSLSPLSKDAQVQEDLWTHTFRPSFTSNSNVYLKIPVEEQPGSFNSVKNIPISFEVQGIDPKDESLTYYQISFKNLEDEDFEKDPVGAINKKLKEENAPFKVKPSSPLKVEDLIEEFKVGGVPVSYKLKGAFLWENGKIQNRWSQEKADPNKLDKNNSIDVDILGERDGNRSILRISFSSIEDLQLENSKNRTIEIINTILKEYYPKSNLKINTEITPNDVILYSSGGDVMNDSFVKQYWYGAKVRASSGSIPTDAKTIYPDMKVINKLLAQNNSTDNSNDNSTSNNTDSLSPTLKNIDLDDIKGVTTKNGVLKGDELDALETYVNKPKQNPNNYDFTVKSASVFTNSKGLSTIIMRVTARLNDDSLINLVLRNLGSRYEDAFIEENEDEFISFEEAEKVTVIDPNDSGRKVTIDGITVEDAFKVNGKINSENIKRILTKEGYDVAGLEFSSNTTSEDVFNVQSLTTPISIAVSSTKKTTTVSVPVGGSNPVASTPVTPPQTPMTVKKQIYRFYNTLTGEHFYTNSEAERNQLMTDARWRNEGQGWIAPESSNYPIYRLCNPNTGEHHYTMDKNEYDTLPAYGWEQEGIGFYSANPSDKDSVSLYRLYNPNATDAGSHHYTSDQMEKNILLVQGWKNEGIAWYGLK